MSVPFLTSDVSRRAYSLVALVLGLIFIVVAGIPAIQSLAHFSSTAQTGALKWGIRVDAILVLSVFCCFRLRLFFHEQHLVGLERRIIVEDLSAEEIADLYKREYLGPTVKDWLEQEEQKVSMLCAEFEKIAEDAETRFHELAELDRSLAYEIAGRMKEICSPVRDSLNAYLEHTKELLRKLEHLKKQQALVEAAEILQRLTESLEKQLRVIVERDGRVCGTCKQSRAALTDLTTNELLSQQIQPSCPRELDLLQSIVICDGP